ncbi:MAG: class I SAM-dependent methyltransferase [Planctomycetaceae bacterium]
MTQIKRDDVVRHPASLVDSVGFVFAYENRVHRAINANSVEFFQELLDNRKPLEAAGLCPTKLSELTVEGAGLVVEHETLPFVTYPADWPSAMLARAAAFICKLQLTLIPMGLSLKDGHPWNILWRGTQPVFVDWGSLTKSRPSAVFLDEVRNWLLFPLFLKRMGMHDAARSFLLDVSKRPLESAEGQFFASHLRLGAEAPQKKGFWKKSVSIDGEKFSDWIKQGSNVDSVKSQLQHIIACIDNMPDSAKDTEWASYAGADSTHDHADQSTWNLKTKNVYQWLNRMKPKSVLDIGCNRGWYSQLARQNGARVLALDIDETSLNTLFKLEQSASDINIAVFDLANPTPSHGVAGAYSGTLEQYSGDMIFALAITHHLYFKRSMSFAAMAKSLEQMTAPGGVLIVEFIPADDVHVAKWVKPCHAGYTLANFVSEFKKQYTTVTVEPAYPDPRVLCICKK